jgi:hypothetical protein
LPILLKRCHWTVALFCADGTPVTRYETHGASWQLWRLRCWKTPGGEYDLVHAKTAWLHAIVAFSSTGQWYPSNDSQKQRCLS